jgi:hypothetical protein
MRGRRGIFAACPREQGFPRAGLFHSQGCHRIQSRRQPRRQISRKERYRNQSRGHACKCDRIVRIYTGQQAME